MRISDWSSDVCSSDLGTASLGENVDRNDLFRIQTPQAFDFASILKAHRNWNERVEATDDAQMLRAAGHDVALVEGDRSEEHTSELQSLMRISYAVFCLKKNQNNSLIQI